MSEVFADSFYFLGLLNPRDQHHARVRLETQQLSSRIVSTRWVLVEVADALSAAPVRARTERFIQSALSDPNVTIVDDAHWFEGGLKLYGERLDKDWSLTDCISFAVMRNRGIRVALTGDHHFAQAGFVPLLRSS